MDPWPKQLSAITLFTEDLAATKQFYADVFGVRLIFEDPNSAVFSFGNTVVNLLDVAAVPELIEPATIGDPAGGPRAGHDPRRRRRGRGLRRARERGVTLLNGPMTRPWGPRTASFRDPAGHLWEIAGPAQPAG